MGLNDAVTESDNAVSPDVSTLTYEQARDELVQVVARLEAGGEPLEASLALWERGEALAARCQEWLDGARARLDAARAGDAATGTDDDTTGGDR
jgi:exodeoxyribonuclease VII small subunit